MADVTQAAHTLAAHQAHTHSVTDVSQTNTEIDVRTFIAGQIYVYHANIETTANATGVEYILQGRWPTGADVNEDWVDLITFQTGVTAAVAAEIAGNEAAGQTSIDVDADPTAAFLRGIDVYVEDKGYVTDGEWGKCSHSVTGTPHTVNLVDGLANAKDSDDTIWTQAEVFSAMVDLSGLSYVRLLMLHTAATGSNIHFKAEMVAFTDIE